MRLFITGATGMIGQRLVLDRLERGDRLVVLSRDGQRAAKLFAADANRNITIVEGNPAAPGPWRESLAGCDAVVHLAGAGLAERRWNRAYKQVIRSSRVDSTHQIVNAMQLLPAAQRPRVLASGSAIGYYGDTGEREVDEYARPGEASDFLAAVCVDWEKQAVQARDLGCRVVLLRTGIVLDERGGALLQMLLPFRFHAGGPIGFGRHWMSWIHWRDVMGLIDLALHNGDLEGPLNMVTPAPVRNREFARALGRTLGKASWLPAPRLLVRAALGEFGKYAASSAKALPRVALKHGYVFLYPDLPRALDSLISRLEPGTQTTAVNDRMPVDEVAMDLGPAPLSSAGTEALVTAEPPMPPAPVRLLAIDVDGTMLRSDASLPQGVIQACRAAQRAGCVVVLATARAPRGARTLLAALDLGSPVINYNGALIWNRIDERPQFHQPLAAEIASAIVKKARAIEPDLMVAVEILDGWHTDRIDPRFANADGGAVQPATVRPLEEILTEPVTKLNLLGESVRIKRALETITDEFWKTRQVSVFLTDPSLIQITHPLVDKAVALQRIAQRLNLQREEVMAIGDASNDLGMIEWAGFGVAVANAYPAVLQIADAVVPSNDDLGVARAIQRFVLARRLDRSPPE